MRLSDWLGAILLTFLVFTAFAGSFLYLASPAKYNVTVGETFQSSYTNTTMLAGFIENTVDISLNMTNASKTAVQLETDYSDTSKSQLRAIKLVWDGFDMVKGIIFDTANFLKIPPVIVGVVLGFITIGLLFGFISLIFRWLA